MFHIIIRIARFCTSSATVLNNLLLQFVDGSYTLFKICTVKRLQKVLTV